MSKITDLIHNVKVVPAVEAETLSADGDLTGEIIDTLGFYAGLIVLSTSADATVVTKSLVQGNESNLSDAEAIPDSNIIEGNNGSINFVPTKRYVQVVLTGKDTETVGATCLLFGADINGKINE